MVTVPDKSDFCFTIKVDSTENIYDLDYEQRNVHITFDWCDPVFTIEDPLVNVTVIVGG